MQIERDADESEDADLVPGKLAINQVWHLKGHRDSLYSLAIGAGSHFFSAGADGLVVQWDMATGADGHVVAKMPSSVYAMCYLPRQKQLCIGANRNGLYWIDTQTRQEVATLATGESEIFFIVESGEFLYVGLGSGELLKVDGQSKQIVFRTQLSTMRLRCACVVAARHALYIGASDGELRIWNLESDSVSEAWKVYPDGLFGLAKHPTLPQLSTCGRNAKVDIWTTEKQGEGNTPLANPWQRRLDAHIYSAKAVAYSPDGRFLASSSMDKTIKIWDAANYRLLKVIDQARYNGHKSSVNALVWAPYNNYLISCSDDRTICVWQIGAPKTDEDYADRNSPEAI